VGYPLPQDLRPEQGLLERFAPKWMAVTAHRPELMRSRCAHNTRLCRGVIF
jgi:hypothetical protein